MATFFSSVGLVACCTLVLAFSVESDASIHESTYGTPESPPMTRAPRMHTPSRVFDVSSPAGQA